MMETNHKEVFLKDTANHSMKVVSDDGVSRHLSFTDNGSSIYRFDLITWSGHLCFSGDCGTYVFSRLEDMFDFFRSDQGQAFGVNASYWGEKLESVCRQGGYKRYESNTFIEAIKDHFKDWEFEADEGEELSAEEVKAKVWSDIESDVLSCSEDGNDRAMDAAMNFESGYGHDFFEFWEHDLTEYTHRYLWCLHAIVWGIQKYDASKDSDSQAA